MKKNLLLNLVVVAIAFLPVVFLAMIWNSIPEVVALHYNARMQADRMGSKTELWIPAGILTVVSIGIFFLLLNLHLFDPKRKKFPRSAAFTRLATGLAVF